MVYVRKKRQLGLKIAVAFDYNKLARKVCQRLLNIDLGCRNIVG